MRAVHDQCRLADALCRWPTSLSRSAQAMSDACKVDWCCPLMVDAVIAHLVHTRQGRCVLSWLLVDAACLWSTSLTRSAQATLDACRLWLMLPAVGRRQCRLVDVLTPQLMYAGLCWWCVPLAYVASPMRTFHVWCVQTLADAAYRLLKHAGHRQCGHATSDIGRLMCAGYGRC